MGGCLLVSFIVSSNSFPHGILSTVESDCRGRSHELRRWQGTRHPYYNVLAAGDIDTMRSMLDFYSRMLPYAAARSAAQWRNTSVGGSLSGGAALYEEVTTLFGTYQEANWGCNTTDPAAPRPDGASNNRFIRFHFTGSLEMSLMALDLYDATQNEDDLTAYLPLVHAIVKGFRQRFPQKDQRGKVDFFPSQALETWGCHNITGGSETRGRVGVPTRETCMTNPSTDIAGLMAVLPRLLDLPEHTTTAAMRASWQEFLKELPSLPTTRAGQCFLPHCPEQNEIQYSKHKLAPISQPALGSAELAAQKQNSENPELYSVLNQTNMSVDNHNSVLIASGLFALLLVKAFLVGAGTSVPPHWCRKGRGQSVPGAADLLRTDYAL
eukprot:COSAG02_NODE_1480_length_12399_cov_250.195935_6_plen_381_part_00